MPGKQRNIRKSKVLLEEDEEPHAIDSSKLEDIKMQQRSRKRNPGLDAESLAAAGVEADDMGFNTNNSELMETYVRAKPLAGISNEEDPHMTKYVEQEIQKRMGKNVQEEEDPADAKRRRIEEELYDVPDNIKGGGRPAEVVIPGLITGITEVVLPLETRLKNIEETEAMKRRLLAAASRGGEDPSTSQQQKQGGMRRGLFASSFGKPQPKRRDPDADPPSRVIKAPRESRK